MFYPKGRNSFITVGELKKYIKDHDITDDTEILIERVEDSYFKEHGWKTIKFMDDLHSEHEYIEPDQPVYHYDRDMNRKYILISALT